jgi:large subunit ribosomal protein L29
MNAAEIRKLPEKELATKVQEMRERLFNLGFKATTEEGSNPSEAGQLKKDIARIQTILSERSREGAAPKDACGTREERRIRNARAARMKAEAAKKAAAPKKTKKAGQKPGVAKKQAGTGTGSGATSANRAAAAPAAAPTKKA